MFKENLLTEWRALAQGEQLEKAVLPCRLRGVGRHPPQPRGYRA
jgi:hypothetical protein